MVKRKPPEVCPVCGQDVPPNAQACPQCGACHESGWKEDAHIYDGLDFLEEGVDEGDGKVRWGARKGQPKFWRVVAVILLLALFWWFLKAFFVAGRTPWW